MRIARLFIYSLVFSMAWFYYDAALIETFLITALWVTLLIAVPFQVYGIAQKRVITGHLTSPFHRENLIHWLSIWNKWIFLILAFAAIKITAPTIQETETEYNAFIALGIAKVAVLGLCALLPRGKLDPLFNVTILLFSLVLGVEFYKVASQPKFEESVELTAPFKTSFVVLNGGNSRLNNSMMARSRSTRRFSVHLRPAGGRFLSERLPDSPFPPPFGEMIYAPGDGRVVKVIDGIPDSPVGVLNRDAGPGNHLIVEIAPARFLVMTFLQQGSILVEEGETITAGQPIAKVGKSGMVTEPVLLLIVLNSANLFDPEIRSFPIFFRGVTKFNEAESLDSYFPTRNDFFRPN